MVSSRLSASRALLAWTVVIEPSWPVFMAWSMSRASAARHSPTMMRSGRMRSAFLTRSRMVTWPEPSALGGRVSRVMTWGCWSWSSAESSMVMMRSPSGMNPDSTLRFVVLPVPVPPETRMLSLPLDRRLHGGDEVEGPGAEVDQVLGGERVLGELPDGEHGAVDGQRRDDGVDPGAVGEAGVDHGRRLVDAPTDRRHDLLDHLPVLGVVDELGRRSARCRPLRSTQMSS